MSGDQAGSAPDLGFPEGFRWGVATAAAQIEGAVAAGGRGVSIWDTFAREPGRIRGGDTADEATDHYHRHGEDVALMAEMGVKAYRFSVAWPRLQPAGRGALNQDGLDFYRRLLDALAEHDIEPWITLYHWDLPQQLQDEGGWPERETALRFGEYAALTHAALGDRARHWITVNEPWCAAFLGYASGAHAPGIQDRPAALRAAHHLLLGHGLAVQAMREADSDGRYGIALNLIPAIPATENADDADAADRFDAVQNRMFLDALSRGRYPDHVRRLMRQEGVSPQVRPGDSELIAADLDFLGVNYYTRFCVSGSGAGVANQPSPWVGAEDIGFVSRERLTTAMGWEVDPDGLLHVLRQLRADYPTLPLSITENGAAFPDVADPDGTVRDPDRLRYLDQHFRAAHQAITSGVDLRGYFVWSLMDNFEWAEGYAPRFGLVHVDYPTQRRTIKQSGHWYRGVIARNGLPGQAHD